ncbi:MAG TPA: YceI family protein [Acidimicrobiales bacterium]|nr:YceI family protein [Acidimicrobiales bacterium]
MSQTTTANTVHPSGTWEIDAAHTTVGFTVRHMMLAKVRGHFAVTSGTIHIEDDPLQSSVTVTIDAASLDTRDPNRDTHVKSPDFLDVEKHPTIEFASTSVRQTGDGWEVDGNLTVHGVTRPVTLELEHTGIAKDPWGNTRTGFEATTEISRSDFGLEWNQALETGGVVVGDKVKVEIQVEAVAQQS